ncbi:MAG: crossover junction endodeoxyribonuclease RuvC [Ferruginibacter sp.]
MPDAGTAFRYTLSLCRMQKKPTIILGIDPGTVIMGHGLIEISGSRIRLIEMDVLKMSSKDDSYERLEKIYSHVSCIIKKFRPDTFAIEAPFFGKNVQSMLKLGRAQGVAIAAAMQHAVAVTEYSPKKVKQSITGNGNANKEQVMEMLQRIVDFKNESKYFDASDALAVAVCHHFQQSSPIAVTTGTKKSKGWDSFLKNNPGRIKG